MNLIRSLSTLLIFSSSLSAAHMMDELSFTSGIRGDDVTFKSCFFSGSNELQSDQFEAKTLKLWQVGLRWRVFIPELDCECEESFINDFFIKGYALWGGAFGNKHFSSASFSNDDCCFIKSCGDLGKFRTTDYQIGLGYYLPLDCLSECDSEWGMTLIGGYAWDKQHLKTHSGMTVFSDGSGLDDDPFFSSNNLTARWRGGWIGTEVNYNSETAIFTLGYEYHFASYIAKNNVGSDIAEGGFCDRRHDHNGYGNVVYLEGAYVICSLIELGLEFKWSEYHANRGHLSLGSSKGDLGRAKGSWQSWSLMSNLGFAF